VTYFCSIGSQILYIFETHGIGQTPSSLERYLVGEAAQLRSRLDEFIMTVLVCLCLTPSRGLIP